MTGTNIKTVCLFLHLTGITITGLVVPLSVGQSATISCMTDIPVTSIEWWNQSSQLIMTDNDNLTLLEYTINPVTDDLQEKQFICLVEAGDTIYTEMTVVQVQGSVYNTLYTCQ